LRRRTDGQQPPSARTARGDARLGEDAGGGVPRLPRAAPGGPAAVAGVPPHRRPSRGSPSGAWDRPGPRPDPPPAPRRRPAASPPVGAPPAGPLAHFSTPLAGAILALPASLPGVSSAWRLCCPRLYY